MILNRFCPSFKLVQESCTLGIDRGVSKACLARPVVREWCPWFKPMIYLSWSEHCTTKLVFLHLQISELMMYISGIKRNLKYSSYRFYVTWLGEGGGVFTSRQFLKKIYKCPNLVLMFWLMFQIVNFHNTLNC